MYYMSLLPAVKKTGSYCFKGLKENKLSISGSSKIPQSMQRLFFLPEPSQTSFYQYNMFLIRIEDINLFNHSWPLVQHGKHTAHIAGDKQLLRQQPCINNHATVNVTEITIYPILMFKFIIKSGTKLFLQDFIHCSAVCGCFGSRIGLQLHKPNTQTEEGENSGYLK